jgi:hypothetical protein
MSNERNVAALADLLLPHFGFDADEFSRRNRARALAADLAAWGVLVPASLSDEEWFRVVAGDEGNRDECVAALERIAKGES